MCEPGAWGHGGIGLYPEASVTGVVAGSAGVRMVLGVVQKAGSAGIILDSRFIGAGLVLRWASGVGPWKPV